MRLSTCQTWCAQTVVATVGRARGSTSSLAGLSVNGQLIGAKKTENGKLSTYFGKLGFYFQKEDMKIEISTEAITLSSGSSTSRLSWSDTARLGNERQVLVRLDSHPPLGHGCRNKPSLDLRRDHTAIILGSGMLRFRGALLMLCAIPGTGNCFQSSPCVSDKAWWNAYSKYSIHVSRSIH